MSASDCCMLEEKEHLSTLLPRSRQLSEADLNERWPSLSFFIIPMWAIKYLFVYHLLNFTRLVINSIRAHLSSDKHVLKFKLGLLTISSALRLSSYLVCICDVTCMALGTVPAALLCLQNGR